MHWAAGPVMSCGSSPHCSMLSTDPEVNMQGPLCRPPAPLAPPVCPCQRAGTRRRPTVAPRTFAHTGARRQACEMPGACVMCFCVRRSVGRVPMCAAAAPVPPCQAACTMAPRTMELKHNSAVYNQKMVRPGLPGCWAAVRGHTRLRPSPAPQALLEKRVERDMREARESNPALKVVEPRTLLAAAAITFYVTDRSPGARYRQYTCKSGTLGGGPGSLPKISKRLVAELAKHKPSNSGSGSADTEAIKAILQDLVRRGCFRGYVRVCRVRVPSARSHKPARAHSVQAPAADVTPGVAEAAAPPGSAPDVAAALASAAASDSWPSASATASDHEVRSGGGAGRPPSGRPLTVPDPPSNRQDPPLQSDVDGLLHQLATRLAAGQAAQAQLQTLQERVAEAEAELRECEVETEAAQTELRERKAEAEAARAELLWLREREVDAEAVRAAAAAEVDNIVAYAPKNAFLLNAIDYLVSRPAETLRVLEQFNRRLPLRRGAESLALVDAGGKLRAPNSAADVQELVQRLTPCTQGMPEALQRLAGQACQRLDAISKALWP